MVYIAPPLQLVLHVKRAIERGHSVRQGVLSYLQAERNELSQDVSKWISLCDQGLETAPLLRSQKSLYRRTLLELLERGLRGEAIYSHLGQLEAEIMEACQDEIARKVAKLPFTLLVPLLLMQFPAFLMLLFGPILENFFHSFGAR